jgi:hypothetical protein
MLKGKEEMKWNEKPLKNILSHPVDDPKFHVQLSRYCPLKARFLHIQRSWFDSFWLGFAGFRGENGSSGVAGEPFTEVGEYRYQKVR